MNIFVNHIQDGVFATLSPSRLGFSDSADIFVLLSGISAALAARPGFASSEAQPFKPRLKDLAARYWRRAARLYACTVLIILATLGILGLALVLRDAAGPPSSQARLLREHDLASLLWHALTLRQTIGYSCVLRLYIALMLMAPLLVRLAGWRVWAPLPPAVLLWIVAGHFGLVIPNSLSGEPFALTILPWTLLFAIGITIGQALKLGYVLPRSRLLVVLALGYLAAYLVFAAVIVRHWPAALHWGETRNDRFWLGASKTYQSPLRLLHLLALAYVVAALPKAPVIRLLYGVPRHHILARLGRRSLAVFTCGAILVVAANEVLEAAEAVLDGAWLPMLLLEAALIGAFVALASQIDRRLGLRAIRLRPPAASGPDHRGAVFAPRMPGSADPVAAGVVPATA